MNVKPKFAVGAMVVKLGDQLATRR
jgi:DNA polymerase-3 subunit delta'